MLIFLNQTFYKLYLVYYRQGSDQLYIKLCIKLTFNIEMINIQSPTFSASSKIDIASKLSPGFRNKRIPSVQDSYVCHWNRVNSCKKLDSPSKISQKNRKRSHHSQQRVKNKVNLSYNLVDELNTLKNQYTSIKIAYQDLIQNKIKNDEVINSSKAENSKLKDDNEKLSKENDRLKSKVVFLEMEVERIKRESLKLIQIQQFRTKKLEENLVQKQKAISSLKQSFKIDLHAEIAIMPTNESEQKSRQSLNSNIYYIEPVQLSHEKTLSNSQFISVSLTSMMQSQNTKRNNISHATNNLDEKRQGIDKKSNKENEDNRAIDNFKKLRKQINKKLEVNIDDRNKEVPQKSLLLDRKNSKSNKASKSKLRRDDESCEHRSSKKKILNK